MSGGVTDWRPMLDIASEWLARTGITTSDNPKLMMINMNEASRLALKATMVSFTATMRRLSLPEARSGVILCQP